MDETLDVLAAHGIAGLTGILFIGFFAQESWNGVADGLLYGDAGQLGWQVLAVLAAPAYAFAMTFVLLRCSALVCRCASPSTRRRSAWTSSSTARRRTRRARARSSSRRSPQPFLTTSRPRSTERAAPEVAVRRRT